MSDVVLIGLKVPANFDFPQTARLAMPEADTLSATAAADPLSLKAAAGFSAVEPGNRAAGRALAAQEKQALDEYVGQGRWPEQRAQAAERITRLIQEGDRALVLNDLRLTQLPDIVKTLRLDTLDVSGNKLRELPVPAQVSFLYVSGNELAVMPVLPEGTRMVFASDNRIRDFRAPLPDTLRHVDAANNALDAIPPFPASLKRFNIAGNTGRLAQADIDAAMCQPIDGRRTDISG